MLECLSIMDLPIAMAKPSFISIFFIIIIYNFKSNETLKNTLRTKKTKVGFEEGGIETVI